MGCSQGERSTAVCVGALRADAGGFDPGLFLALIYTYTSQLAEYCDAYSSNHSDTTYKKLKEERLKFLRNSRKFLLFFRCENTRFRNALQVAGMQKYFFAHKNENVTPLLYAFSFSFFCRFCLQYWFCSVI